MSRRVVPMSADPGSHRLPVAQISDNAIQAVPLHVICSSSSLHPTFRLSLRFINPHRFLWQGPVVRAPKTTSFSKNRHLGDSRLEQTIFVIARVHVTTIGRPPPNNCQHSSTLVSHRSSSPTLSPPFLLPPSHGAPISFFPLPPPVLFSPSDLLYSLTTPLLRRTYSA